MTFQYSISALLFLLLNLLAVGSLLNLSSHPHWFVRAWDFPRVQIIFVGWAIVLAHVITLAFFGSDQLVSNEFMGSIALLLTAWHGVRIIPYTPFFPTQSASTSNQLIADHRDDPHTVRMVTSNVEMENDQYDRWMAEMRDADPDILLVLEIDDVWLQKTEAFRQDFSYQVVEPQDNWFGMLLLSKLPIIDHKIRYLVEDDVPSIDAQIRLKNGTVIRFVAVHPRPPEPIRGNDATARDAELTLWGKELESDTGPVIIGGDLNDVAWSQTTRLFLRTSGLLDPRRGRGFFNSFHADHFYLRFPLDHIFHSPHFTISKIQRLGFVGSDHFPILIDLRYAPEQMDEHRVLQNKENDESEIELRVQRAVENDEMLGKAINDSDAGQA